MPAQQKAQDANRREEMIPATQRVQMSEAYSSTIATPFSQAFDDAGLQDIVSCQASHAGLVYHLINAGKPVIWVQDHASKQEFGTPYLRTMKQRSLILHAPTRNARDALWAMEEAVKAGVNVIGEIMGAPRVLDFTATRRLELFSRAAGVRCLLVRTGQQANVSESSGARWRWRVDATESEHHPFDARAPGRPRWTLELLRARSRPPGRWVVESSHDGNDDSGASHRLRLVSQLANGNLDSGTGKQTSPERRQNVVSLR